MNFLKQLIKEIGDESTSLAEDGASSAEFSGYIDTGSLIFNAALSGSIFGGMPNNKILALGGEEATGKTFFALGLVKHFFDTHAQSAGAWYMSEPAVTKQMLSDRGIDPNRVMLDEPETVEQWKFKVLDAANYYLAQEEKPPFIMVLDSLGNLSTNKELKDSNEGKDILDMTRAKTIRATFRTISLKLARANIPLIVTNHTYAQMDQYKPRMMSGGGGLKYAGDMIAHLTKSKDKDDTTKEVYGDIIHVEMQKNRFARPFTKVDVYLNYEKGLDKYYGLIPLAEKAGILTKLAKGYETEGYKRIYDSQINEMKDQFWTPQRLAILDVWAKKEFGYGGNNVQSS